MEADRHPAGRAASAVLLALALLTTGCGADGQTAPPSDAGPRFVTTLPALALVTRPVVEPRGTVTTLLPAGASPHAYEPRPSDARRTAASTALLYGTDALDGWAATLPAPRRLAVLDLVPSASRLRFAREDGPAPGAHPASGAYDPHAWTDPLAVRALLPALADTLCALDAPGCGGYRARADSFATRLATLDARLRARLRPVAGEAVMLAQPFFRYFLRRYGLRLVAVVEPQPGAEPAPRRLARLVRLADSARVRAMLVQAQLPARSAAAVAEAARLPLVRIDPLGTPGGRYDALLTDAARALRAALAPPDTTAPARP